MFWTSSCDVVDGSSTSETGDELASEVTEPSSPFVASFSASFSGSCICSQVFGEASGVGVGAGRRIDGTSAPDDAEFPEIDPKAILIASSSACFIESTTPVYTGS